MTAAERNQYITEQVRARYENYGWVAEVKESAASSRSKRPLDTVLRWVAGLKELMTYYAENPVRAPAGTKARAWVLCSHHIEPLVGRKREWLAKANECAELLQKPLIRRRCRIVEEACTERFQQLLGDEDMPDDAASVFSEVEGRADGEWSVDLLHKVLTKAKELEEASVRRLERK